MDRLTRGTRLLRTSVARASAARLHEEHRTLDERAFYPPHAFRKDSAAYERVHRAMTIEEDQPCLVCGVRASTLRSRRANPYGATAMETHHHVIEWALANAVDPERFAQFVVTPLAQANPKKYGQTVCGAPKRDRSGQVVARRFARAEMLAWIDHDRDNLWVLCDVHHRHRWFGVHAISGPIWEAQRLLARGFAQRTRSRLSAEGSR